MVGFFKVKPFIVMVCVMLFSIDTVMFALTKYYKKIEIKTKEQTAFEEHKALIWHRNYKYHMDKQYFKLVKEISKCKQGKK